MNIINNTRQLLDVVKPISEWLRCEKDDSMTIDCMHELGTYTATISMENGYKKVIQLLGEPRKRFDANTVYKMRVFSLKPFYRPIDEAVYFDGKDIVLDLKKVVDTGVDDFRLEVDYKMNMDWLDVLVKARSPGEALRDKRRYHLTALLKDPESLVKRWSSYEIDEYPVKSTVYVQQDVSIPQYIRDIVNLRQDRIMAGTQHKQKALTKQEAMDKKAAATNPHHIQDLIRIKQSEVKFRKKYDEMNIYNKLQDLAVFLHSKEVYKYFTMPPQKDFRLDRCVPSDNFEAIGMVPLPKEMEVVTRTDLSLKKPATSGELIYEQDSFSEKIRKILGNN